jgi:hypothetical protein
MEPIEVHLNRRGINSIEVPTEIEVETGSIAPLRLTNHGSPIHVTISSSNSALFTRFYHENLYIQDFIDFPLPIKEDAHAGFFDIDIITGYGTKKASLRIFVVKATEKEVVAEELVPELPEPADIERARLLAMLIIIAGIAYIGWLGVGIDFLNYIAFLALLGGVYIAWSCQR